MENIIFDVDGVILDYMTPFAEFINQKYNTNYGYETTTDYDFGVCMPEINVRESYTEFLKTPTVGNLQYFENMKEFVNKLAKNFNIIIITAISDTIREKREFNLNGINYKEMIFDYKKENYLAKYKPKYIFEDATHHITDYINKKETLGVDFEIFVPVRPWNMRVCTISKPKQINFYMDATVNKVYDYIDGRRNNEME